MGVTREDVKKVAALARLRLREDEIERFQKDLNACFNYVDQLREVNTDGVEPLHHLLDLRNVTEADVPHECLPRETALRDAPDRTDEFFRMPRVVD
jgi:aspartyl-tRNA(Asn)/glutamyl-tRNA(Gln) amidotransferase subunit C